MFLYPYFFWAVLNEYGAKTFLLRTAQKKYKYENM